MEPKFYEPKFKDSKILAFADIEIVDGITVRGFRVVNGDKGLFASVPQRPVNIEGETRYLNQVVFSTPEKKEKFLAELLEAYEEWEKSRSAPTQEAAS